MLPIFCLRLASGLIAALLILPPALVNPRFYRTHFLTVLGLTAAAAVFVGGAGQTWLWVALSATIILAFMGSLVWSLEGAPASRVVSILTLISATSALCLASQDTGDSRSPGWALGSELGSAALLGTATTAMLMGHSYLIAPGMSLTPLLRLLLAFFAALFLRGILSGVGLWFWAGEHSLAIPNDVTLFLALRWGIGFVGPFVLGIMAWKTTIIRSTQSATGILYVVVILTFLGELVGQVLLDNDLLS